MQPTTPTGSRTISELALVSSNGYVSASDAAWLKLFIGRPTWISCDSHFAMPVSFEIAVASSSMRAPSASPIRVRYLARSSTGVDDHAGERGLGRGDRSGDVVGGAGRNRGHHVLGDRVDHVDRFGGVGCHPRAVDVELVERCHARMLVSGQLIAFTVLPTEPGVT